MRKADNWQDAFKLLVEGNRCFYEGNTSHPERGREIMFSQYLQPVPFAAILSCADSRVVPELVFDVDAKDIPIRSCGCSNVCEVCLNQAKDIVHGLVDTIKGDLGLSNIHVVYSGRGYHIRVLDDLVMGADSDVRSQIVKYLVGSEVPRSEYSSHGMKYNLEQKNGFRFQLF